MALLDDLFAYYRSHQDELVRQFSGRYIVIVANEVVGDFAEQMEAYNFATGEYAPETFLIQQVTPGEDAYMQTYHSRVTI
jgi:hypothetical protein